MDGTLVRMAWQVSEPVHCVTYFAPESRAAGNALGLRGGWMCYFGFRGAPLGAVSAGVAVSTFYNFSPTMVHRALPDAWATATPGRLLEARWDAVDRALRRVLGPVVDGAEIRQAAGLALLAARAVRGCGGRPLAAANAELHPSGPPHLVLWQALTTLREHRGDGHVAVLVGHSVDPCQSHVLAAATGRAPAELLQKHRGWSAKDWAAATESLAARGWLDEHGSATTAGRAEREIIEDRTDTVAASPYQTLGDAGTKELIELLRPLAHRIVDSGEVPVPNPVGLPWPPPRSHGHRAGGTLMSSAPEARS